MRWAVDDGKRVAARVVQLCNAREQEILLRNLQDLSVPGGDLALDGPELPTYRAYPKWQYEDYRGPRQVFGRIEPSWCATARIRTARLLREEGRGTPMKMKVVWTYKVLREVYG